MKELGKDIFQILVALIYSSDIYLIIFLSFKIYIYLFLVAVGSSLLHVGFLQLRRAGATLCCGARVSHCGGFSCCGARALGAQASVVVACGLQSRGSGVVACGLRSCDSRALERRLSSCGAWAQLPRGMWDFPGPGLEPMSPALAGGFLTTVPPGKSLVSISLRAFYVSGTIKGADTNIKKKTIQTSALMGRVSSSPSP